MRMFQLYVHCSISSAKIGRCERRWKSEAEKLRTRVHVAQVIAKESAWTTLYFGRECDFAIVTEGNKNWSVLRSKPGRNCVSSRGGISGIAAC